MLKMLFVKPLKNIKSMKLLLNKKVFYISFKNIKKTSELVSKCRRMNKLLLANYKTND